MSGRQSTSSSSTSSSSSSSASSSTTSQQQNGFKNSKLFRVLTWRSPDISLFYFAFGLCLYTAIAIFEYSLPEVCVHIVFFALFYSALSMIARTLNTFLASRQTPTPTPGNGGRTTGIPTTPHTFKLPPQLAFLLTAPQLPINAEDIRSVVVSTSEMLITLLTRMSVYLQWTSLSGSVKALAYAWLGMRFSGFLTPGYLLFFWVLAFTIAPLYNIAERDIDTFLSKHIIPHIRTLSGAKSLASTALAAGYRSNPTVVPVVGGVVVLALLWFTWDFWTFGSIATLISMSLLIGDVVDASQSIKRE